MQLEPFFLSRSEQAWICAGAQCTIGVLKQMTFSSRRPLTPHQLVVGWYLRGWEKATCEQISLQLVLASGLIKVEKTQRSVVLINGSPLAPQQSGCRVQHQSRCAAGNSTRITDVAQGMRWGVGKGVRRSFSSRHRFNALSKSEHSLFEITFRPASCL